MIYARICVNCMKEKPNVSGICPYCGFDSSKYHTPAHHLPLYTRLSDGRYIVGKAIGSGGFGITYIAFDTRLDIPVAIKELYMADKVKRENTRSVLIDTTANGIRQYEEIKKRFMQEAIVLAEMETIEGLVKVKDYFQENETAYIVMEYLDGKTMKQVFLDYPRRMTLEETVSVLAPVMEAVTRLHNKGIIHRDVSLDNIMLLKDGRVKLIDLGGGKRQGDGGTSTVAIRKSAYTPIEQILGRASEIGPQTDVYAMAVTIYRCICGKFPKAAGEREGDNDLEKPSRQGVKITKKQEAALCKALIIDPRKRTQTIQELYDGLMDKKKKAIVPILIAAAVLVTGGTVAAVSLNFFGPDYNEEASDKKESKEKPPEESGGDRAGEGREEPPAGNTGAGDTGKEADGTAGETSPAEAAVEDGNHPAGIITAVYNSSNGADVRWEKTEGATGYNVYRERSAEGTVLVASIRDADTLQYIDEELQDNCWGRVYHYYVCPVFGTEEGPKSKTITIKRMAPAEITSSEVTENGVVKLSWTTTKEQKADGYELHYARSKEDLFAQKGTFDKIFVDDGAVMRASIAGLEKGEVYYFRVRCYGSYTNSTTQETTDSWSQYSDTVELKIE